MTTTYKSPETRRLTMTRSQWARAESLAEGFGEGVSGWLASVIDLAWKLKAEAEALSIKAKRRQRGIPRTNDDGKRRGNIHGKPPRA